MSTVVREVRYKTTKLGKAGTETRSVLYQCDLAGPDDAPIRVYDRGRKEWSPCGATKDVFSFDSLLWLGTEEAKANLPDHGIYPPSGDLGVVRYVEAARRKKYLSMCPDEELPPLEIKIKRATDASRKKEAQQWMTLPPAHDQLQAAGTLDDFLGDLDEAESVERIKNLRRKLEAIWKGVRHSCCLSKLLEAAKAAKPFPRVSVVKTHRNCAQAAALLPDMSDDEIRTALVNDLYHPWLYARRGGK